MKKAIEVKECHNKKYGFSNTKQHRYKLSKSFNDSDIFLIVNKNICIKTEVISAFIIKYLKKTNLPY